MAIIYINYGSFDGWAGKIKTSNETLKEDLYEIQRLINSLAGEWESNSAVTIREKITGMGTRFEEYYRIVNNYAVFLRNTAAEWKTQEQAHDANAQQFI